MSKLVIQPHGRLNDWVADEKGYFRDLGLDYEINLSVAERNSQTAAALKGEAPIPDIVSGAFESYKQGNGRKGDDAGDISATRLGQAHLRESTESHLARLACDHEAKRPTLGAAASDAEIEPTTVSIKSWLRRRRNPARCQPIEPSRHKHLPPYPTNRPTTICGIVADDRGTGTVVKCGKWLKNIGYSNVR